LKKVIANNPEVRIFTNSGVAKILDKEGIKYELLEDTQSITVKDILIKGFGTMHADIYKTIVPVVNTGYFIQNRFFYPGDALYDPKKKIEILALPVAGPWMKLSEAIDYAKKLKPEKCFPVHEGMLREDRLGPVHRIPAQELGKVGIEFTSLLSGGEIDYK